MAVVRVTAGISSAPAQQEGGEALSRHGGGEGQPHGHPDAPGAPSPPEDNLNEICRLSRQCLGGGMVIGSPMFLAMRWDAGQKAAEGKDTPKQVLYRQMHESGSRWDLPWLRAAQRGLGGGGALWVGLGRVWVSSSVWGFSTPHSPSTKLPVSHNFQA